MPSHITAWLRGEQIGIGYGEVIKGPSHWEIRTIDSKTVLVPESACLVISDDNTISEGNAELNLSVPEGTEKNSENPIEETRI